MKAEDLMPTGNVLLTTFAGYIANQAPSAFFVLEDFLNKRTDIKRICEIGTAQGGTTVLFGLHMFKNEGVTLTFDNAGTFNSKWRELSVLLGIEFSNLDVFKEEGTNKLKEFVQRDGVSLLFCDGGNKVQEFNSFAPFLKSGDVIMAHDYRHEIKLNQLNKEVFEQFSFHYQEDFDSLKTRILCMVKK